MGDLGGGGDGKIREIRMAVLVPTHPLGIQLPKPGAPHFSHRPSPTLFF